MSNHALNINTILHTKNGSKIGNAIVTGREGYYWEITTDYGNKVKFTSEEIDEYFNIAWLNCSKEIDGYSCQEMQKMMSSDHKHRVAICDECGDTGRTYPTLAEPDGEECKKCEAN